MRVQFIDKGAVATIEITSYFWQRRKRLLVLDAALFAAPRTTWHMHAGFIVRTVISGPIIPMMRAHKAIWREVNRNG